MIVTLENNQTEIAIPEELEETLKRPWTLWPGRRI